MRALRAIALLAVGCVADEQLGETVSALTCGPGTTQQGNLCIAPAVTCGPGTHAENQACVADDVRYLVRTSKQLLVGTPVSVVAFGRNPDGTPATDPIVFNTNRPGSGLFAPTTATLAERGAETTFTPCDGTTPGCLGPLEITAALASAPTTPVARFDVDLVNTPMIGSVEHCLTGGNVLYLEGDNFMYRGALTVTDATFMRAGGTQRGSVVVVPTNAVQGTRWSVEISTVPLGMPMMPGVYLDAYPTSVTSKPLMNITGQTPYAYCNQTYRGDFQVHAFEYTTSLQRMTVSFRQWCGVPGKVVQGCVHIE